MDSEFRGLRCDDIFPPRICPVCGWHEFEYQEEYPYSLGSFVCLGLIDIHPDCQLIPCGYTFYPNYNHFVYDIKQPTPPTGTNHTRIGVSVMVTYKSTLLKGEPIENVYLDGIKVGILKIVNGGWCYFPKGQKTGGNVYPTLRQCKMSLGK